MKALALLLAVLAMAAVAAVVVFLDGTPPRAPAPPASPVASLAAGAFRSGFAPLVADAAATAGELVVMGEARERNLLRIRERQGEMLRRLAAADAWLATRTPPAEAIAAVAAYHEGAAAARSAMSEAQAGFLRFDFARVARATETMRESEAALRRAAELLASSGPN